MKIIKFSICAGIMCLLSNVSGFAQTGTLHGIVIENATKETVIGATVQLKDLNLGTATDVNGQYILRNIPAGTHKVTVSYIGLQTVTITDLEIAMVKEHNSTFF
ncbi:hypothetical protein BH23BAC3_BH23BAC3_06630 [soil metagenome]